jgi:hypothetical protein
MPGAPIAIRRYLRQESAKNIERRQREEQAYPAIAGETGKVAAEREGLGKAAGARDG